MHNSIVDAQMKKIKMGCIQSKLIGIFGLTPSYDCLDNFYKRISHRTVEIKIKIKRNININPNHSMYNFYCKTVQ